MNKIYFANVYDLGGAYIAAPNIKEAKKIAYSCDVICNEIENYIDLRIHWVKNKITDYEGELNIKQINELGLTWWGCPNCDEEDFEIIDEFNYRCKKCNQEYEIPYCD